jgi:type VI secretion system protein ImpB
MASNSYQNEVPKARVNIRLDLHTGGAQQKLELPLKLMVMGDYSNGREQRPLSERSKVDINKGNFNQVMAEYQPALNLDLGEARGGEGYVDLNFRDIKDFEPEQVARQIPQLRAMLAMRNLLRDLKSNLLDNATFRRELERILKDDALSATLRAELAALAPQNPTTPAL